MKQEENVEFGLYLDRISQMTERDGLKFFYADADGDGRMILSDGDG